MDINSDERSCNVTIWRNSTTDISLMLMVGDSAKGG